MSTNLFRQNPPLYRDLYFLSLSQISSPFLNSCSSTHLYRRSWPSAPMFCFPKATENEQSEIYYLPCRVCLKPSLLLPYGHDAPLMSSESDRPSSR